MFSLASLAFAPSLPTLTGDFCADVVETLTVDGSAPLPGKNYTLCVDKTNVANLCANVQRSGSMHSLPTTPLLRTLPLRHAGMLIEVVGAALALGDR